MHVDKFLLLFKKPIKTGVTKQKKKINKAMFIKSDNYFKIIIHDKK